MKKIYIVGITIALISLLFLSGCYPKKTDTPCTSSFKLVEADKPLQPISDTCIKQYANGYCKPTNPPSYNSYEIGETKTSSGYCIINKQAKGNAPIIS